MVIKSSDGTYTDAITGEVLPNYVSPPMSWSDRARLDSQSDRNNNNFFNRRSMETKMDSMNALNVTADTNTNTDTIMGMDLDTNSDPETTIDDTNDGLLSEVEASSETADTPETLTATVKGTVATVPDGYVTRDCNAWATTFKMDKVLAYGFLRGLVALGKVTETAAPRVAGQRGKNKVLYSMSPAMEALFLTK